MKKTTTLICLVLISASAFAQDTFQKSIGGPYLDVGEMIKQCADGSYVFVGYSCRTVGPNSDFLLVKINLSGDTLWSKTYGGPGYEYGEVVCETTDGGYLLAGETESFGAGFNDVMIVRTDSLGNLLWSKVVGGTNNEWAYGAIQTADGGFAIAGSTTSFGATYGQVYIFKVDASGNLLWSKMITENYGDQGSSLILNGDGGFLIAGNTNTFSSNGNDFYLIKTDSVANVVWVKTYGLQGTDFSESIIPTTDGGYALGGVHHDSISQADLYLVKIDSGGNLQWSKTYGGTGNDYCYSVVQAADSGYYLVGGYNSTSNNAEVYLIRTDSIGNMRWSKTYGGSSGDHSHSGLITADNGFLILGDVAGIGMGGSDMYLIKTDSSGNSGCYETTVSTTEMTPPTTVLSPPYYVNVPLSLDTVPVLITAGGCMVNTLCTTVNIEQNNLLQNSFSVFPNPVQDILNLSENGDYHAEIFNSLGECLLRTANRKTIDVSLLPAGIYFLKIFNEKSCVVERFVKSN